MRDCLLLRQWKRILPVHMGVGSTFCKKGAVFLIRGDLIVRHISPGFSNLLLWQQTLVAISTDLTPIARRVPYQLPLAVTLSCTSHLCDHEAFAVTWLWDLTVPGSTYEVLTRPEYLLEWVVLKGLHLKLGHWCVSVSLYGFLFFF